MKSTASSRRAQARVCRARSPSGPRYQARSPSPANRSPVKGCAIMPKVGRPLLFRPISVPHTGRPVMKERVPSIGSSTHTRSASSRSEPYSSPRMPWSGKHSPISARIAASAARSATVTGSKAAPSSLFSTASRERKCGRIAAPAASASRSRKATRSPVAWASVMVGVDSLWRGVGAKPCAHRPRLASPVPPSPDRRSWRPIQKS